MKPALIFVGGIHGVGKSSLCSKVAKALNLQHFSAGELIKPLRKATTSVDKRVADVNGNQNALVEAIHSVPLGGGSVLLDGHFCVLNSAEEITKIPIQVFEQLAPLAAVVIHDDVQRIQERLRNRDGNVYSTETLAALQDAESAHAQDVCSVLRSELRFVRPDMLSEATQFIAEKLAADNL